MQREDLKYLSREQLECLICEWAVKYHDLYNEMLKCERDNSRLEETVRSHREKIDSLMKEPEEEKGKTITISDGGITMKAETWEILNENTSLKQQIKDLEDVVNNYEPQFARDDDISAFNYECVKKWITESGCKRKIQELQDQHKQDCIKINQLNVTIDTMVDKYSRLRETAGMD